MMMKKLFFAAFLPMLLACQQAMVPENFAQSDELPPIWPDYVDVTVPVNIAPLTFMLDEVCVSDSAGVKRHGGDFADMVVRFSGGGREMVCSGLKAQPSIDDWRALTSASIGEDVSVEVFTRDAGDEWTRFKPFAIHVSADSIDPWLSYRLISPSYVTYEELTLNQRCLENYDERVMVDNMLCGLEETGQCVNCHSYQQYNPERMQFHARQFHGGTVVAYDGTVKKINMKCDSTISAGVYPAWHPWLPFIVYSTNHTSQSFHTRNPNKIEVFDSASDLIAFDLNTNEVTNIEADDKEFEVFPAWVPDGKTLYYCSAHFEFRDTVSRDIETIRRAKEVKYNIYKKAFDPQTRRFGPRQLVFRADTIGAPADAPDSVTAGKSATLPRVSPDGRFLMFTLGTYGVFHIWHHESDLYLMDLTDGSVRPMDEINSSDTESYHSWSSNGRWVVFSSRRDDGGFTRPYIAHIDADGHGSKPFELPQGDPSYHREFMKSYNIPELMKGPVQITPQQFADVLKSGDGQAVKYVQIFK